MTRLEIQCPGSFGINRGVLHNGTIQSFFRKNLNQNFEYDNMTFETFLLVDQEETRRRPNPAAVVESGGGSGRRPVEHNGVEINRERMMRSRRRPIKG